MLIIYCLFYRLAMMFLLLINAYLITHFACYLFVLELIIKGVCKNWIQMCISSVHKNIKTILFLSYP